MSATAAQMKCGNIHSYVYTNVFDAIWILITHPAINRYVSNKYKNWLNCHCNGDPTISLSWPMIIAHSEYLVIWRSECDGAQWSLLRAKANCCSWKRNSVHYLLIGIDWSGVYSWGQSKRLWQKKSEWCDCSTDELLLIRSVQIKLDHNN